MALIRLGLWVGLSALALSACAAEDTTQSVTTQRALAFNTSCEFDLTGDVFRSSGAFDVTSPAGGYILGIEIANNTIEDRTAQGVLQSGRRIFVYQGVHVRLRLMGTEAQVQQFENIDAALRSYDVPGFGTIEPRVQNQPASKIGVGIDVFPPQLVANNDFRTLAAGVGGARIIADLTVFGEIDGSDVEANTVGFPIDICSACLLRNLGACDTIPTTFTFSGEDICIPGQDSIVDCCTSTVGTASVLTCPGKGTMTP